MPDWGATDILGSSGKGTATQSSNPAIDYLAALLAGQAAGGGATTQAAPGVGSTPTPAPRTSAPNTGTGTLSPMPPQTVTGPPAPGDHWQGGAPGPNGPVNPQSGGRWVDPTYRTDANGNPLSPEEQQKWRDYDRQRAEAASIRRSNQVGAPASPKTTGNAVHDPITDTWSILGTDGKWTHGVKQADLQAQLPDNLKQQYPDWWWGQYAAKENQSRRYELDAGAFDSQKFASMGQQSTRYSPTNF